MPENQTVWKSNNQGVKEETFIQTGRRGRDGQLGWRDSQDSGWRTWASEVVAGTSGKLMADRAGSPTIVCR